MKRFIGLLSLILFSTVSCSKKSDNKAASGQAMAADANWVRIALDEEPPTLNSLLSTDQVSFQILGHVMEGLTKSGRGSKIEPGVAEKWEAKGLNYTFTLRKNAVWSDGKPVTAHDFVFAWRSVVEPKTASQYAYIMYSIKNAQAINQGKMPSDQLGVKALDDNTLQVTLERPTAYFVSLTAFPVYLPIREDFYKAQGEKYAANAENLLCNGAFKLTVWKHGASLRMEKNASYWDAANVTIEGIDSPFITSDTRARFNLFKDNSIDMVGLNSDTLEDAIKEILKINKFDDGTLFYMEFNHRDGHLTKNKNLRKALQLVHDSQEHVNKVIAIPGTKPGSSIFPSWIPGVTSTLRSEFPLDLPKPDYVAAKKYLEMAKKELKIKDNISLVFLTGDSPVASKEAEYLQSLFKEKLGIDLKIDKQIFKQRLDKMTKGEFDIVAAGWGPDYNDAMTFGDLFASWNENNRGKYSNPAYDKLVKEAQESTNDKARMVLFDKIQKLVREEVVIIPTYEASRAYLLNPRLEGVVRMVIGPDPLYTFVKIQKNSNR